MCIKFEEPKIHHAKKNTRFIQKRVHQKEERFIKHRNVQAHRGKKDVERVHQNDLRKTEAKDPQKVHLFKRWKTTKKKKKKKKRKPARLKTQKGSLGKS